MADTIETLLERIRELQKEIEERIEARRQRFRYRLEHGRVVFDREIRHRHRALKISLWPYVSRARLLTVLTAPVIYSLIVPLVLLDVFVAIYQAVCFPAYGIPKVPRRDYIAIDRHRLQYLNALEKLNCVYCGYANGLLALVSEIASRTEAYWCPIKHARKLRGTHARYPSFADYGDGESYRTRLAQLRAELERMEREAGSAG